MDQNETPKPIDYRAILEAMEAQYAALARAIAEMRVLAGVSGPLISADGNGTSHMAGVVSPADVPAGVFHGKSMPQAAMLYLRMVKQKQKTADIAAALRKGGIDSRAQPDKYNGQVHSQLDRASKKEGAEIVKVQGAYWALKEWYPPNVRASMGTGAGGGKGKKGKGKGKKRPGASPKASVKAKAVPQPATSNGDYRSPKPESTEGQILAAMRKQPDRLWTPREVTEAAGIPRVQTAVFLMGKLAHRDFLLKRDDGLYVFRHA
jgi:hypothetical protein